MVKLEVDYEDDENDNGTCFSSEKLDAGQIVMKREEVGDTVTGKQDTIYSTYNAQI